jgi:hypothetical protein
MHVFMIQDGVKVRVNCERQPSIETISAIKKMVSLVSKTESNAKGKTVSKHSDRS